MEDTLAASSGRSLTSLVDVAWIIMWADRCYTDFLRMTG